MAMVKALASDGTYQYLNTRFTEVIKFAFIDASENRYGDTRPAHTSLHIDWTDNSRSIYTLDKIDTETKFRLLIESWDSLIQKDGLIDIQKLEDEVSRKGRAKEVADALFTQAQGTPEV